jgi:type I restriction enzyme S subunit
MNRTLESMSRVMFRQWFVDGEEVKKWDEVAWGDIATLEYGKSLSDYRDSDAPYVVYGTNGPIGRHTEALYSSEGIIIGRKGAYRGIHYSPNPFFVIDTAFYLKPQRTFSMKWAYYELLQFDLNGMDSGSAIPSTSRTDFYNIPVLYPPQELMNSFETFVTPLFSKIYANNEESRTLASLRDSLLPKLMRGEVRVSEL